MKYDYKMKSGKWIWIVMLLWVFPVWLFAQNDNTESQYYNPTKTEQKNKTSVEEKKYKKLPYSTFMTVHFGVQGDYVSQSFFDFRTPTFGLKVGTMKNTGWFIGFMSNFNFKGILKTFDQQEHVEKNSYTYVEGILGLTGRYFKPVSFHFGFGFYYSMLNHKRVSDGVWGHWDENMKYGPVLTAGFMFHIRNFVLSIETSANYNIVKIDESSSFESDRVGVGAKVGIGFCIPNKSKKHKKTEIKQNRDGMGVCKDLRKQLPL